VKSEQEINEILPKRDQYLVSTSEFDDMKTRLRTQITNLRKQKKPGPTLQKREAADNDTAAPDQGRCQIQKAFRPFWRQVKNGRLFCYLVVASKKLVGACGHA
jgi:hypothetical protein